MSEEFQIQCQTCGTLYNDLEEVCPYCGTPQPELEPPLEPVFVEEDPYLETPYFEEEPLAEEPLPEEEAYYPDSAEESFEEDYLDEYPAPEAPFADEEEDIFAVAGEPATAYPSDLVYGDLSKPPVYDDEFNLTEPEPFGPAEDEEAFEGDEEEPKPRFQRRGRLLLGCLGAFICIGVLYGGIGVLAAYNGLQERADDVQAEAEQHYQRGENQLLTGNIELAIAEFERALSLNPNLLAARESLREAQRVAQSQPTPTSETRSAAAAALLEQAETEISEEQWAEAFDSLSRVRDLNPDYKPDWVSELYFKASYEHGLSLVNDERVDEALQAFQQALVEQPDNVLALAEKAKASFYIRGREAAKTDDFETAIDAFDQLYQQEPAYLDVEEQLWRGHEQLGDELATAEEWCLAEDQFVAATQLAPDNALLKRKAEASHERCTEASDSQQTSAPPTRTATPLALAASPAGTPSARSSATTGPLATPTSPEPTAPAPSPGSASGTIYYSMYNPNESRWEILSVPAGGGNAKVVVLNGTMPAVSPNGRSLVYRSEASESEGFHLFDLTSGQDKRISILRQDILPRWGSDNSQFVFTAQEPATGRWLVQVGFADGKGQAQILRDGRTPDWAANGLIAYQGSDAQGNNPGLYVVPFNGGDTRRVTTHESDRAPDFSPNSNQLVYMSTQAGNWDIYTINVNGGGTPRQLTTYSGNDGLPVWSPDGSKVAYVSDSGGGWSIYTLSVNGGAPQKVTAWDGKREDWLLAQIWWAQ